MIMNNSRGLAMWTLSKIVMLVFLFTMLASVLYYNQWMQQVNHIEQAESVTLQIREGFNRVLLPDSLESTVLVPIPRDVLDKVYTLRVNEGEAEGSKIVYVTFAYGEFDSSYEGPWDAASSLVIGSDVAVDNIPLTAVSKNVTLIQLVKTLSGGDIIITMNKCSGVNSDGECIISA